MIRNIGLTGATTTTVYRAAFRHTTRAGNAHTRYAGLYDMPGPARAWVTRELRHWAKHLEAIPEETVTFDAWVEQVTVTNHPGVRFTDDWAPPADDRNERLKAIRSIADVLSQGPTGDLWRVAQAIECLGSGSFSVGDAREWLGEGWETL